LDHLVVRVAHVALDRDGGDFVAQDGLDELHDEIDLRLDRKDDTRVARGDVGANYRE